MDAVVALNVAIGRVLDEPVEGRQEGSDGVWSTDDEGGVGDEGGDDVGEGDDEDGGKTRAATTTRKGGNDAATRHKRGWMHCIRLQQRQQ